MPPRPRFDRRAPVRELPNINDRISYPKLRVVDADGSQLGVINREEALDVAKDRELDLVLVSEKADPPVCRIMDYGKFKFEQEEKKTNPGFVRRSSAHRRLTGHAPTHTHTSCRASPVWDAFA